MLTPKGVRYVFLSVDKKKSKIVIYYCILLFCIYRTGNSYRSASIESFSMPVGLLELLPESLYLLLG